MTERLENNRSPANAAYDADPVELDAVKQVPAEEEVEVDFEKIEGEMGKMLIFIMRDRRNHFYVMSEVVSKEWKEQVSKNAGSYSWKKWNVTLFPMAKIGLDVLSVTIMGLNPPSSVAGHAIQQLTRDNVLRMTDGTSRAVDTAKQFFDTVDTGTRTEGGARSEQLKIVFEKNEREAQNFDSQTAEAERKLAEARKKREDFEQAMAR
jgi:hypothetical protein